ncbi:putative phosphoesterase [Palleronia aestuarii]|uniref:Putative phosphoesterase n=1 Tax=Palleronia aestuarii TaxID=568105 RepID=A0A2W7NGX6_9RHOB|nr:ligase-associated DNA damage response endonuclease PdeM [Palleronia aestuarii]PZX19671.1 putative phosphoesterase [Palleronia aestuarii]
MNSCDITLAGQSLRALGSGALHWPEKALLVVSDLHLGKAERLARRGGAILPPYETRDTLLRLEADIRATDPARIICLGDSLDDDAARAGIGPAEIETIDAMQCGRDWIWITGNHDPAPRDLGGRVAEEAVLGPLGFRHIAGDRVPEISGHYHPKARLALGGRVVSRRCFLHDANRIIMPAYGTYTGGLDWTASPLADLMHLGACAVLTGQRPCKVPVPRPAPPSTTARRATRRHAV